MDGLTIGKAGLQGWRAKVADAVADPVSRHSPLSDDEVRAVVGTLFLVLALIYVLGSFKRLAART